ncbi:MAG TPA: type II toxin-antitoxin system VapC family toxin [Allosphingosinicella sp.]|nr:type II toxin-antitoxin system VapC family toxin [Allosphingosinicella sp.]
MLLLLDTHILISLARGESERLPSPLRDALHNPGNTLFASAASLWEIAIKHRLGKLTSPCELDKWPAVLAALAISLMDIYPLHTLAEVTPVPNTKDPFDRLLLAICDVENMRLVTADGPLLLHPLAWKLASA